MPGPCGNSATDKLIAAKNTMILSYHPCFTGDENRLCAGREPDHSDAAAMRRAKGVILPQGCRRSLFEMAAANCDNIFPDYTLRFTFPGKIGQARLFANTKTPHPETHIFESLADYHENRTNPAAPLTHPFVFKFSWSGEGDNVWLVADEKTFDSLLGKAADYERTGQKGFVIQRFIETGGRSLRVVVIGKTSLSYWRMQPDTDRFSSQAAQGALIDHDSDPVLQAKGKNAVMHFCRKTGIGLAGFDVLFDRNDRHATPLFLEINYYFGRRGIGGSEAFYALLVREIEQWIASQNLRAV